MTAAHPLAEALPRLILGGAGGFTYLTHPDPLSIPVHDIVREAFDFGVRAIDTSPFYEPSEELIGKALAHPRVSEKYLRSDYVLMTKVGRISQQHFDYSPDWVRKSVLRSLNRLGTTYLDVVFCHDIESVTDQDTLDAVRVLLEFVHQGQIKYVGLSSYRIDILAHRTRLAREIFGRPIDVVQNWGQLTIQNCDLETEGIRALKDAGVPCVCTSSPLAMGLLRKGGVPSGKDGDTHGAPAGLRRVAEEAATWLETQSESLASLALRYTIWRAHENSTPSFCVRTVTGVSSVHELRENIEAVKSVFKRVERGLNEPSLNEERIEKDKLLFLKVRDILGEWHGWGFTCPPKGWSQHLKRMVEDDSIDYSPLE